MNYYIDAYKKSLCHKHYWALIFEQGTNQPYVICRNCNHKEKVYWVSSVQRSKVLSRF